MPNDKKLTQVNLLGLLPVKGVGDNFAALFKNHRAVLTREPAAQPFDKLRHRHLVSVSLIPNQLVIQGAQCRTIIQRCASECHRRRNLC